MSLETGKRIHSNKWVRMEITNDVINKVHLLAENENQPWIHEDPFTINWSQNNHKNEVCDVAISVESVETNPANEDKVQRQNEIIDDNTEIQERARTTIDHINDDETISEEHLRNDTTEDEYSNGTTTKASDSTYDPNSDGLEDIEQKTNISSVNSDDFSFNIANIYDEDDHSFLEANLESDSDLDIPITELTTGRDGSETSESIQLFNLGVGYEKALHVIFTQISAQKGIKMFGEKAIAAMFKELIQLNDGVSPGKPMIVPISLESLSDKDKEGALDAVNLIAQKRCR